MIGDIERGDLLAMTQKMGNVFEPGIIEKYPVIGEIKALMESHGALKAIQCSESLMIVRRWRRQQRFSERAGWRRRFLPQK